MKIKPVPARADRGHLHSDEYRDYLDSDRWREVRAGALERAGHRCQAPGCASTADLEVHHLGYEHLGNEAWGELRVLCRPCHEEAARHRFANWQQTRGTR